MASTRKLITVMNWARPFLKNQPLDLGNMEPALTIGNMVLQTIFTPPFRWRFTRNTQQVGMVAGQSDYVVYAPDFAYLEDQWIQDTNTGEVYPLEVALSLPLAPTANQRRPTRIAAQNDDGQGNITFRTKERPDRSYLLGLSWQTHVPQLVSLASYLTPLPDEYGYLFDYGFLTLASLLVNDARFPVYERMFIGKLLGLQDGLDEAAVNIFLGQWALTTKTAQRASLMPQQGAQGRSQ